MLTELKLGCYVVHRQSQCQGKIAIWMSSSNANAEADVNQVSIHDVDYSCELRTHHPLEPCELGHGFNSTVIKVCVVHQSIVNLLLHLVLCRLNEKVKSLISPVL